MSAAPNISFEIFPPKSEKGETTLWQVLDRLAPLDPGYISVTYGAGGTSRDTSERIVRGLLEAGDLVPAAHLTCVAASREETDRLARQWWAMGVRRIVALRGDMPGMEGPYRPHNNGYLNAADLVGGLKRTADFHIAVAAYPEKHPDSPSVEADIDNLKQKFDNGADVAITQFFFDPDCFLRFRDRVAAAGISAPIVPGVLPISNFARARDFAGRCGASVPDWLEERFDGLDQDPPVRDMVATATAAEFCNALIDEGVDAFHIYTLNRAPLSVALCRALGVHERGAAGGTTNEEVRVASGGAG